LRKYTDSEDPKPPDYTHAGNALPESSSENSKNPLFSGKIDYYFFALSYVIYKKNIWIGIITHMAFNSVQLIGLIIGIMA
jgi:hypothetical protein